MLRLVVDTNLFHEFRSLPDLPWQELEEADEIVLFVTEPVQTELDEHKKSPRTRLKKRALKWMKEFRRLVLADQTDIVLRDAEPRVVLRLDGTRPDTEHNDVLDLSVPDDCIVALALRSQFSDSRIAVFSDDLRPLRKARQVALNAKEIPEEWRREPEQTDEDKARAKLEEELALFRQQEPVLTLSSSPEPPIEFVLPIYQWLSEEQLEELIDLVQQYNPIENDFEKAKHQTPSNTLRTASLGFTQHEFQPASAADIEHFTENAYPAWVDACRERLSHANEALEFNEAVKWFQVGLANIGTRPADGLQVEFRVKGDIGIMPDDREETFVEDEEASFFSLPEAPAAPQGEWKEHNPRNMFRGLQNRSYGLIDPHITRTLDDVIRDQKRDPNAFYYRDRPDEPVSSYSLTCEQFRHAEEPFHFNLLVRPSADSLRELDGRSALLEVICNAANLISPETLKIPIQFRCEVRSTYDAVLKQVNPLSLEVTRTSTGEE